MADLGEVGTGDLTIAQEVEYLAQLDEKYGEATAAAGARRATTGTAGPYRLPAKPWWKVHRDFIPWTTTPSTRPCRKCVNPLPDVAAAVRVGDGYIVDEDRPSKRFLGCENVSFGQWK